MPDIIPSALYHCLIHLRIPMMLSEEPICEVRREVTGAFQGKKNSRCKGPEVREHEREINIVVPRKQLMPAHQI